MEETEIPYKSLSRWEKFERFKALGSFSKRERKHAFIYLKALWLNDHKTLEDYEKFGEDLNQIIQNKRDYEHALSFGYTEIKFDEYGWFVDPELEDLEVIEFKSKKRLHGNSIEIGRTINGVWFYGLNASSSQSGMGNSAHIWNTPYPDKKTCMIAALTEFIKWHMTKTDTKEIINQAIEELVNIPIHDI